MICSRRRGRVKLSADGHRTRSSALGHIAHIRGCAKAAPPERASRCLDISNRPCGTFGPIAEQTGYVTSSPGCAETRYQRANQRRDGASRRSGDTKPLAILAVLAAAAILAVRKMVQLDGPAVRARCSEMCERMLNQMPESFPPNRMMADLDDLKEQTARILDVLERQAES